MTCLALFVNSASAKRRNASASAVRRTEKARFLFITIGLDWKGMRLDAGNRKRDTDTYISSTVNMNHTIRYNPRAFDNSWVLLPYAARIPDPGMKMAA